MLNDQNVLLRSVLYVPGSNQKALAKATTLGADALIIDLEDSVAPEAKADARVFACNALKSTTGESTYRTVRINGIKTDIWKKDLETVFPGGADAIVIPKVEHVDELQELDVLLTWLEQKNIRRDVRLTPIWAMIESPLGVIHAFPIASHRRVSGLVLGTSDLTSALGTPPGVDRSSIQCALQQTVLAAKAAQVVVIDGVFLDLQDADGFVVQCREGARLGFAGKTIIHPRQVAPANQAFLPAEAEVVRAKNLLQAWHAARERGEEICVVDGSLVERLHAKRAEVIVAMWEQATAGV